ncbi:MAG TPA: hypothetical protein VHN58_05260 [Croceicoccus sp.]|nr:hypothetical protein [Croceicoccus sp.]
MRRTVMKTSCLLALTAPLLGGCLAKAAYDVATAPVRVASKAVDLATTSQSEADEKRGRELRKHEEEIGKLERRRLREQTKCDAGDAQACEAAAATEDKLRVLIEG